MQELFEKTPNERRKGLIWSTSVDKTHSCDFVSLKITNTWNIENEWFIYDLQSSQVKRTQQDAINEFIIRKLNPLVVVDFRFISAFLRT